MVYFERKINSFHVRKVRYRFPGQAADRGGTDTDADCRMDKQLRPFHIILVLYHLCIFSDVIQKRIQTFIRKPVVSEQNSKDPQFLLPTEIHDAAEKDTSYLQEPVLSSADT